MSGQGTAKSNGGTSPAGQITQQKYESELSRAKALARQGASAEAEAVGLSLLQYGVSSPGLFNLLGGIALAQGRYDDAMLRLKQAVVADPRNPDNHYNLGIVQQQSGQLDEAIKSYNRSVILKPDHKAANLQIVRLLQNAGNTMEVLPFTVNLCCSDPADREGWILYMQIARGMPQHEKEVSLRDPLQRALQGEIFPALRGAALRQISFSGWSVELDKLFRQGEYATIDEKLSDPDFVRSMLDPLLLNVMSRSHIPAPVTDFILNRLRRQLLLSPKLAAMAEMHPLLLAMWQLCFINEYVFAAEDDEMAALEPLRSSVKQSLEVGDVPDITSLALLGSYVALAREEFAETLAAIKTGDETLDRIIEDQLVQPLEDRRRAESIPTLSAIEDETTMKVRAQYESNPYPRWRELPKVTPCSVEEYLQLTLVHHNWNSLPDNPGEVLIAGCGTGQHAIEVAHRLAGCKVLAVDISLASLAYARRKAEELNISNIEFLQADILNLDKIGRKFDVIESVGVLHHMRDPMAGWQVLTGLLRPGGVMKIGLYSSTARRAVNLGRKEIKETGIGDSDDAIRNYRKRLIMNAYNNPAKVFDPHEANINELFFASDFYTLSECRDLLFHVQEHQFTLPKIKESVQELGLNFLGIHRMDENRHGLFHYKLPEGDRSRDFELWHEYEQQNPDAFSSMYRFWLQKPAG